MNPDALYSRMSEAQRSHASEVLPGVIASILGEVQPQTRSAIIRRALQLSAGRRGPSFPMSHLIPRHLSQEDVSRIWDGMSATLTATSLSSPSQSLADVLRSAASLVSGKPMAGEPTDSVQVPLSSLVNAVSASGISDSMDPDFKKSISTVAQYYDCAIHKGYLGGSIIDGIRGVAQEIAGVFSKKKDLQGDYTRAKYRYDRDPSSPTASAALADAAKILVNYLRAERPSDKLLADTVLTGWADKSDLTDEQAKLAWQTSSKSSDLDSLPSSGGEDADGSKKDDASSKDHSASDDPAPHQHIEDPDLKRVGTIDHTQDLPEAVAILKSLVQQASIKAEEAKITSRSTSLVAYRIAAALAWLNAGDEVIASCLTSNPPSDPNTLSIFKWCLGVAKALSATSEEAASALAAINVLTPTEQVLPPIAPQKPEAQKTLETDMSSPFTKKVDEGEKVTDRISGEES